MYRGGTLSIGPLSLPYTWLFIGISFAAGYLLFSLLMRNRKEERKIAGSLIINALLIFIGVWKISPLLFQWQAVSSAPMLLLYLPGGVAGSLLGVAAAGGYLFFSLRKRNIGFKQIGIPFIAGAGTALFLGLILNFVVLSAGPTVDSGENAEIGSSPGDLAPDFSLRDINNTEVSLSDFSGKIVFVNFWATWCPPCKAEIPEMVRFYREHDSERAEILAVNLTTTESSIESIRSFVQEREIGFPVLLDEKNIAEKMFHITAVPTTLVINQDGVIIARKTGSINRQWMKRFIPASE